MLGPEIQSPDSESLRLAGLRLGGVIASKYRVDGVLGTGGMGIVVAATHLQLGDPFAIKVLRPEGSSRVEAVDRFLREARIAMRLRGEHVVRIYEVGTLENGSPFIAMERLDGRDLRAVIHDEGRVPPAIAVDYVLQACEAIAEAHALGAIHRDLKPANLFLTRRIDGSDCVKVLDFGISKIAIDFAPFGQPGALRATDHTESHDDGPPELAETARVGITRTRALLGSPKYMAPEQLRSPRDVDVRADIWALGAILCELLSGKAPFDGDSLEELQRAIVDEPAPPLAGIATELEWCVHRCLAKEPRHRFESVASLAEGLAPFASDDAESARILDRIKRLPRGAHAVASPPRPQPWIPAQPATVTEAPIVRGGGATRPSRATFALSGAAVIAMGAGLFFASRREPTRSVPQSQDVAQIEDHDAMTAPSMSASDRLKPEEPAPAPVLAATPRAIPSTTPMASARSERRSVRARPVVDPVASAPAIPIAAASPAIEPDPLRIDAGTLFDERK